MVVQPTCPTAELKGDMVLKIFDRRYAAGHRENERMISCTPDFTPSCHLSVMDGEAGEPITELSLREHLLGPGKETSSSSEEELNFDDSMDNLYKTEVEAYNTLADLQGHCIPRLLSCVTVPVSAPALTHDPVPREYADVPGMLLQYIKGFRLDNLPLSAPKITWQTICEDAIRTIHRIGDRGVLNQDVKPRNFMVQTDFNGQYHLFMIDFGCCEFIREVRTRAEWQRKKASYDEEGAIGFVMEQQLPGGFVYRRSDRYTKLRGKYMMEGLPSAWSLVPQVESYSMRAKRKVWKNSKMSLGTRLSDSS